MQLENGTEDLPLIFEKILTELLNNGGSITTDKFKTLIYNTRITEDEIINSLYGIKIDRDKIKSIRHMIRPSKCDAKEIKNWLIHNGYITITKGLREEIITLENR